MWGPLHAFIDVPMKQETSQGIRRASGDDQGRRLWLTQSLIVDSI